MIIEPDFLDSWQIRMLIDGLGGDELAPFYVIRIWAHCQRSRSWIFDLRADQLRALCRASSKHDPAVLERALVDAGFVLRNGASLEVPDWAVQNASLVAAWSNGQKGGRPRKEPTPIEPRENPQATQGKPTGNPARTDKTRPDKTEKEHTPRAAQDASVCVDEPGKVKFLEAICSAMHECGLANKPRPTPAMSALIDRGATMGLFVEAAHLAGQKRKGIDYTLAIVGNKLDEAVQFAKGGRVQPPAWDHDQSTIQAKGIELGLGVWNRKAFDQGKGEPFEVYKRRVRARVEGAGGTA